jgi:hypothetical protein
MVAGGKINPHSGSIYRHGVFHDAKKMRPESLIPAASLLSPPYCTSLTFPSLKVTFMPL